MYFLYGAYHTVMIIITWGFCVVNIIFVTVPKSQGSVLYLVAFQWILIKLFKLWLFGPALAEALETWETSK